jgi:hypothetical protein
MVKQAKSTGAVRLLEDNIHNLEHPDGWIKHPYFNQRLTGHSTAINAMKHKFCEAIIMLLEDNHVQIIHE